MADETKPEEKQTPAAPSCDCAKKLEQLGRALIASGNLHTAGDDAVREIFGFEKPSRPAEQ